MVLLCVLYFVILSMSASLISSTTNERGRFFYLSENEGHGEGRHGSPFFALVFYVLLFPTSFCNLLAPS
ncbi:MAG: hypothetical protein JOS17DRAFT_742462 [Linnemannia elongata]|nr:MAG: hypothetical protein JOS17DRAFT_742462 [Linnemannia elongata]